MPSRRRFLAELAGLAGLAGAAGAMGSCTGDRRGPAGGFLEDPGGPVGSAAGESAGAEGGGVGPQPPGTPRPGDEPRPGPGGARASVVVVGAGMSGLAAAWWLARSGVRDVVVLEAAPVAGGNARWGEIAGRPHPWGGRQVAVPGEEAAPLRTLLEDLDVLRGGVPDPRALVEAPAHRLFRWGRWRRGLVEALFETARERRAWRDLRDAMAGATATAAGEAAADPWTTPGPLDRTPMETWLVATGLDVPPSLRWLVEHRCRDRWGAGAGVVSARAGLAALMAPPPDEPGLSWPEGTGGLARRLVQWLTGGPAGAGGGVHLATRAAVRAVEPARRGGGASRVVTERGAWTCEAVIWAAPVAAAAGVVESAGELPRALRVTHAPWVVANLTLDGPPAGKGVQPAWHNVRMGSRSTGYVPADHQTLRTRTTGGVWTWYRPLDDDLPARARDLLRRRPWEGWVEEVLSDLQVAHPDIRRRVRRLDVRRLPRGTAIPVPGRLDEPARRRLRDRRGAVVFAHADLAALPRVEYAVAEGVRGARAAMSRMGGW